MIIAISTEGLQVSVIVSFVTMWAVFAMQRINITNHNLRKLMNHFDVDWEGPEPQSPKGKVTKDLNK